MSDPADLVGATRDEIAAGVEIVWEPVPGGEMKLIAEHEGDVLARGQYADILVGNDRGRTNRGEFLNSLEEALTDVKGVDAGTLRKETRKWFNELAELADEEETAFLPEQSRRIIEGTHYPVEIHGGETTTWNVELTYADRTSELEFTAAEMVSGDGGALQEKLANHFFELVEIEPEDWEAIRERWHERSEVVNVVEETASDAIADRVLSKLSNTLKPVGDRDHMGNDVAAAWYDAENATVYEEAPPTAAIVWVQDSFLVDQLEAAGKNLEYKGQLIKDLIARGDIYGSRVRKKWAWDSRTKLYPFDPDALGVTADDVGQGDDPNHSEVSA